jgi:hypothetical protein
MLIYGKPFFLEFLAGELLYFRGENLSPAMVKAIDENCHITNPGSQNRNGEGKAQPFSPGFFANGAHLACA